MAILVHKDFTFIVQGITGREALNFTRECLEYGSKIVGGVTPGKGGTEDGGEALRQTAGQGCCQTTGEGSRHCTGNSERLVAQVRRPGVTIATKAGRRLPKQAVEGYTRENLAAWIGRSRANLGVDRLDLLQLQRRRDPELRRLAHRVGALT